MGVKRILKKKSFTKIVLILVVTLVLSFLGAEILMQQSKINALNMSVKTQNEQINKLQKSELPQNEEIEARRKELLNQLNSQNNNTSQNAGMNIQQGCQEDQARYNSCLTEYNTKLLEYQSCLQCKENKDFGCDISCIEPYNTCNQYKPSTLCN